MKIILFKTRLHLASSYVLKEYRNCNIWNKYHTGDIDSSLKCCYIASLRKKVYANLTSKNIFISLLLIHSLHLGARISTDNQRTVSICSFIHTKFVTLIQEYTTFRNFGPQCSTTSYFICPS